MKAMAILNYIIEANVALLLVLAFYLLFLRGETSFRFLRFFLLAGIGSAIIFPLIHIENSQDVAALSISQVLPSYWLPETVIGDTVQEMTTRGSLSLWHIGVLIYGVGLTLVCAVVVIQFWQLLSIIRRSKTYRLENLQVAESSDDKPIFSFFRFIFIGRANMLSEDEKEQVIRHERVHAQQWHSCDILLISLLQMVFWFNPFIRHYKKLFIQLHEFEADARAVESSDINKYCNLLAKVALKSAGFTLANHFNNSLTIKRIEMMRALKTNIRRWKLAAVAAAIPAVFFFVACQDQVADDLAQVAQNSTHALIVPDQVQARFEQLKKANPNKQYVLLELNETASGKLKRLEEQYGLPASLEVLKTVDGKVSLEAAGANIPLPAPEKLSPSQQTFAILEYTTEASRLSEQAAGPDKIYTVVAQSPEYVGGFDAMIEFIEENLHYSSVNLPEGADNRVFVSFIVEADGAISDVKTVRGLSPEIDAEAMRVVQSFPSWAPGRLKSGEPVRVRFVLPIKFQL